MLIRLALCVDPNIPEAAGIVAKALRGLDPKVGKSERDRAARAAKRRQILGEALEGLTIPQESIYPDLGERWGRDPSDGIGIRIPAEGFRRLTEKIIRGIYFVERGLLVEPPYTISYFALSDEGSQVARTALDRFGREYAREPGIVVRLAAAEDEPMCCVAEITIWNQFKMFGAVQREP